MKKFGMIILFLIILLFNFIIGANDKGLRVLPIFVLMLITFIYLVIKKIKNPKDSIFIKNKVDVLILAFMFITTLPLIFKTYASYSDTIEFILKYFFMYSVYILARNTITTKKDVENLINFTLVCSLIPILLGLDLINGNHFENMIKWLNLEYYESSVFSSTFGYANAVAIYVAFCLILVIHKIKNTNKKIFKILNVALLILYTYILYITSSRAVIILLICSLITYFLIINRKVICKHWKKILIFFSVLLIISIPIITMIVNTSKPLIITDKLTCLRLSYYFTSNVKYTLELDIKTELPIETIGNNAFDIQIIEGNKYFNEKKITYKRLGKIDDKIKFEFTPSEEYSYINLVIVNSFNCKAEIRKCYINGEEYVLNYKYVPKAVGDLFALDLYKERSVRERLYIYDTCLKIAKDSLLIGKGGNTWRVLSTTELPYSTVLKETHSYFFELLISYGIIGVISFLSIIIVLFIKLIKQFKSNKECKDYKILIVMGVFLVLFHSILLDFCMSFMLISILLYIYIASLLYDDTEKIIIPKFVDYIIIFVLFLILTIYGRATISEYFINDIETKQVITPYNKRYTYEKIEKQENEDYNQVLKYIKDFINKEPYYKQTMVYKLYFEQICNNIEKLSTEQLEEYMNFGINKLKTIKFITPLFIETILDRTEVIVNTTKFLSDYMNNIEESNNKQLINNYIEELKRIVYNEYDINCKNIKNIEQTGYSYSNSYEIYKKYIDITNQI